MFGGGVNRQNPSLAFHVPTNSIPPPPYLKIGWTATTRTEAPTKLNSREKTCFVVVVVGDRCWWRLKKRWCPAVGVPEVDQLDALAPYCYHDY